MQSLVINFEELFDVGQTTVREKRSIQVKAKRSDQRSRKPEINSSYRRKTQIKNDKEIVELTFTPRLNQTSRKIVATLKNTSVAKSTTSLKSSNKTIWKCKVIKTLQPSLQKKQHRDTDKEMFKKSQCFLIRQARYQEKKEEELRMRRQLRLFEVTGR